MDFTDALFYLILGLYGVLISLGVKVFSLDKKVNLLLIQLKVIMDGFKKGGVDFPDLIGMSHSSDCNSVAVRTPQATDGSTEITEISKITTTSLKTQDEE
jgi:hypothetical protein